MKYRNESRLVEQGTEFALGPEPSCEVGGCENDDARGCLPQAGVHLERLALARLNRHRVEPHRDVSVLQGRDQRFGRILAVDARVTNEDVVLLAVVEVDSVVDAFDQSLLSGPIDHRSVARLEPAVEIVDDFLVVPFSLAVVGVHPTLVLTVHTIDLTFVLSFNLPVVGIDSTLVLTVYAIYLSLEFTLSFALGLTHASVELTAAN